MRYTYQWEGPIMGLKEEQEFRPVTATAYTEIHPNVPGLKERILADEGSPGTVSRILRLEPGTDTSPLGQQRHDFWEEVYILDGSFHDVGLNRTFGAGDYACRPPGMPHGPWTSETGCTTFEVRYTKEDPTGGFLS